MNDLLHILVCDDEPACVKELGILLKQYEKANKDIFEIISVTDFEQRDDFNADIIFLDIEMPKKDGIKIKNELESLNCKSLIIFVTNHTESIYDAFGTNVIGFLPKPVDYAALKILMDKARCLIPGRQLFEIEPGIWISIKDIRYIEMDNIYSEVYFVQGTEKKHCMVRKTMLQWMQALPETYFMQINKSCIIGLSHIKRYEQCTIVLDGGEKFNVSRRRKVKCREAYRDFVIQMSRLM